MDQFNLPRYRAPALPPIGRPLSFTSAGVTFRSLAILTFALTALAFVARGGNTGPDQARLKPGAPAQRFAAIDTVR